MDIAFFLVPHKQFKNLKLNFKKNCIVIDSNNVFSEKKSLLIKKYKKNYIIGNYN